jgi:antitoxin MazE
MDLPLVAIGNSKGIRLPKAVLELYQIGERLELILERDHMVLRPARVPREGWNEAFEQMHADGADQLLISDSLDSDLIDPW